MFSGLWGVEIASRAGNGGDDEGMRAQWWWWCGREKATGNAHRRRVSGSGAPKGKCRALCFLQHKPPQAQHSVALSRVRRASSLGVYVVLGISSSLRALCAAHSIIGAPVHLEVRSSPLPVHVPGKPAVYNLIQSKEGSAEKPEK
ncbi:hypothetical protein B0H13DRAFT_1874398 [Mycena leptocephala]|nr:hypothetical protein B0H13DRAFT_1874398 [Mycena leptocephala]